VTIRTKLYAAIAVTVAGLALAVGVAVWGMSQVGDRFDSVRSASAASALALELKYDVTDTNGWQTAYGYDNGRSRPVFLRSAARFRRDLARARRTLVRPDERTLLGRIQSSFDDFMRLDGQAYAAVLAGRSAEVRRLLLGPEITNFHAAARSAQGLADLEASREASQDRSFTSTRRDALRLQVLAALVAGLFVAILLVTATDLARTAERNLPPPEPDSRQDGDDGP
jgi:hypothetical protein